MTLFALVKCYPTCASRFGRRAAFSPTLCFRPNSGLEILKPQAQASTQLWKLPTGIIEAQAITNATGVYQMSMYTG